ncbi:unnamed protein product [Leptidea sinapis]|uniref:Uncharacterized protein n=1 Tax=Leptidea sinapis TaxID=189913 RepID=A0A5E4PSZ2_9NEOP|nr:unnamed protein product [Leptidea sinapis]
MEVLVDRRSNPNADFSGFKFIVFELHCPKLILYDFSTQLCRITSKIINFMASYILFGIKATASIVNTIPLLVTDMYKAWFCVLLLACLCIMTQAQLTFTSSWGGKRSASMSCRNEIAVENILRLIQARKDQEKAGIFSEDLSNVDTPHPYDGSPEDAAEIANH